METVKRLVPIGTGDDVTGMQLVSDIEKCINEILRLKRSVEKLEIYVNNEAYSLLLSEINAFRRIGYVKENSADEYIGQLCGYPLKRLRYTCCEVAPFNYAEYRIVYDDYDKQAQHNQLWISTASPVAPLSWIHNCISDANKIALNSHYGLSSVIFRNEEKKMKDTSKVYKELSVYDRLFNRFFDSGDALIRHIKSVTINRKKGVTTVIWDDGVVTMVRPMEGVEWDEQQAIDECILKKLFKTNSHHKKAIGKIIDKARVIEEED